MVGQTLPLAVTLLLAPSRCWCSALPKCHQTNTYKPNCCPFAAHMYLTPFCAVSSPSLSAEGADTTAVAHHQSHWQVLVTPLGPLWGWLEPLLQITERRDRQQTFCQSYQWDLPLSFLSCAVMLRFASCGIQPQHCPAPCELSIPLLCDHSPEPQTRAMPGCFLNLPLVLWQLRSLLNNHPATQFSPHPVASCK